MKAARPLIDWLRRDPATPPVVAIGEERLPVIVRRLDRARRMTMRLSPCGQEVRITVPRWTPTREALAFAEQRADWLARQRAGMGQAEPLADGTRLLFRGTAMVLRHDPAQPRRVGVAGHELRVGGPITALSGRLRRWLQDRARELLADDLADYCARAGLAVPALALSNARRRWGSCAADGTIRINWRLVMAPDTVRRSVVAHEVAHLVHFDHSPAFHACLAGLFEGDLDAANLWLKREGRALHLPFG